MRREYRERFLRHRLQRKPLVSNPDMHHGTCVTRTSRHGRHARVEMHVGVANPRCRGKRSRRSRRMRNPQFYVSGKRPMQDEWALILSEISATCATSLLNTNVFSCFWYNLHDKGSYLPVMNQCWFIQWVRIVWNDMNPYTYSLFLTIPIFQFVGQVYSFFYKCISWIYEYKY